MSRKNIEFGKSGEEAAVDYLEQKGYRVLERNFKNPLGEIDIIAKDKKTICFIEVKTRSSLDKGYPQEAINRRKQRKLSRVALSFLKSRRLLDCAARFDIVSVIFGSEGTRIDLIQDAFELDGRYLY
jgi:putative endonuclease